MSDLEGRIDRLVSLDQIRQLPAKIALALDMRDSDAWVNLFPDDVRVRQRGTGHKALRDLFGDTHSRQNDRAAHHIGGRKLRWPEMLPVHDSYHAPLDKFIKAMRRGEPIPRTKISSCNVTGSLENRRDYDQQL